MKPAQGHQAPLPFFAPRSEWVAPDLGTLPSWKGARRVAFDLETRDEQLTSMGPGVRRKNCYIVGYSFAVEDGPKAYVPLRHDGGGNVDVTNGLNYLRAQAADFEGDIAGAGLQYDLDWAASEGVEFKKARFFRDVQIAAPLLNELELSYSLESIAGRAGIPGKDETLLTEALAAYGYRPPHVKRGLWVLPARYVGPYGEQDATLPLQLLARQERELEEQDLWRVWDLESRVLPILVAMRRRGVRVSLERLAAIEEWSRSRQIEALAEVKRETGVQLAPVEVTKPEAVAMVLKALGVEVKKTSKGKTSIKNEQLSALSSPAGKLLVVAREMAMLRSTFVDAVREHAIINPYTDEARIHCSFNQLRRSKDEDGDDEDTKGAAYGRLSCENPNLQQQPSPDKKDYGKRWRSIYLPDDGELWGTFDYSQQEPRMAIHYAVLAGAAYIGAFAHEAALRAAQQYHQDPKTDFHDMMTRMVYGDDIYERVGKDQFKLLRRGCKEIYLGLSYGMGGPKLCRKLGLPTKVIEGKGGRMIEVAGDEGQKLIDTFNAKVPFVRQTAFVAQQRAKEVGYIVTLSGRRCRFPKDEFGNYDWTHKAFNRLVQGASADQTKMALVALVDAGFSLQLQVHDEVDRGVANDNEARDVATIMETCADLTVPSRVDIEIGLSWGEAA